MPPQDNELEGLLEAANLLASQLDSPKLLSTIVALATRVVRAERASLLLVDEVRREVYFDVALGLAPSVQPLRLKVGQGIAGWVAAHGKSLLIADVRQDPRWDPGVDRVSGFKTRTMLAVPVRSRRGRVLGVVEVLNKKGGPFTESDRRLLEALAAQAAVALENTRLFSQLRAEKRLFEAVVAEMQEGALLVAGDGRIELANATARALLDMDASAADLAQAFAAFRVEPPLGELLKAEAGAPRFEATRTSPKRLLLAGSARRFERERAGGRGEPLWLWVFHDATEEHREKELKRDFLALISHKLRTPLAILLGHCNVLEQEPSLTGQARLSVQTISRKSRDLAAQVEKLLKFTWLQGSGSGGLKKRKLTLSRVLEDALGRFQAELHDGTLRLSRGPGLRLTIQADPQLLREALENLIENAIKFRTQKTVFVRIEAARDWGVCVVRLVDDGPGIPPEDKERVFSKFYQVEEFFTGQVEGLGLGLPFVAQVMKAHGGSARLESKLGRGTTVLLALPAE